MHALLPKSYTKGGWERIGGWISIVKGCAVVRRRVEGTSRGVRCCQEEGGGYERGALLPRGGWRVRVEGCAVARRRVKGTGGCAAARVLHQRRTANTYRRMDPSV